MFKRICGSAVFHIWDAVDPYESTKGMNND